MLILLIINFENICEDTDFIDLQKIFSFVNIQASLVHFWK